MSAYRIKDALRVLGAGLFVFIGLGLVVALFSAFFHDTFPLWIGVPLILVAFFGLLLAAMVIFRGKGPSAISAEK